MAVYDVFNGDADGICALIQLHLAAPRKSQLLTGVKRDIQLLDKLQVADGDQVTVLDISLDRNRAGLQQILEAGAAVFYVDHHYAGAIPQHAALTTLINTAPEVCTSLLVNGHLGGTAPLWAVVGAFGDNLDRSAALLAKTVGIDDRQLELLKKFGRVVNYNSYGASLDDLHCRPQQLFEQLVCYHNPLDFITEAGELFRLLSEGYDSDVASAESLQPVRQSESAILFILPDAAWARRVSGEFSNRQVRAKPDKAFAILTEKPAGGYLVSVRAPRNLPQGADELVRNWPDAGGRAAAAGINHLPATELERFAERFEQHWA